MAAVTIVRTPVPGYTGLVVGVRFTDGVGETTDPVALGYFRRRGYHLEAPRPKAPAKAKPKPTPEDTLEAQADAAE